MEKQKSFDAVRTMREIRQRLGRTFEGMTFEEQRQYIRERVQTEPKQTERASSQNTA